MTQRVPLEIILTNLGTPSEPTAQAVRVFLREFLGDPMVVEYPRWFWLPLLNGIILRTRPKRVAHAYQSIWSEGGSPLRVQTEAMAQGLQGMASQEILVSSAYRYGSPNIEERLTRAFERAEKVLFTSVFPQRTASSAGSPDKEAGRVARALGMQDRLHVAPLSPVAPGYIQAVAERVLAAQERFEGGALDHLLLSFHSIPDSVNRREGERYSRDCEATFEALLERLRWPKEHASLAYQSVFGPAKWIGPATSDRLGELGQQGVKRLLVSMPGFMSDGLETLEEIAIEGKATFLQSGGQEFHCAAAVQDHPALMGAYLELAEDCLPKPSSR